MDDALVAFWLSYYGKSFVSKTAWKQPLRLVINKIHWYAKDFKRFAYFTIEMA
jgi:hypothetical protein